jgi:hypothetical protein
MPAMRALLGRQVGAPGAHVALVRQRAWRAAPRRAALRCRAGGGDVFGQLAGALKSARERLLWELNYEKCVTRHVGSPDAAAQRSF